MGYFLANIVGPFFQCIYLIIKANVIKNINFHNKEITKNVDRI